LVTAHKSILTPPGGKRPEPAGVVGPDGQRYLRVWSRATRREIGSRLARERRRRRRGGARGAHPRPPRPWAGGPAPPDKKGGRRKVAYGDPGYFPVAKPPIVKVRREGGYLSASSIVWDRARGRWTSDQADLRQNPYYAERQARNPLRRAA